MDVIGTVLAGLVLLIFHVLTFYFIISDIRRMIVCSKKVDAKVSSVIEKIHEDKDSKTGKTKTKYSYKVTFKYDYNGQAYESQHTYSNHCNYSKNQNTFIKINPHKPTESWTKGEIKDVLLLSLSIPLYVFFDLLYISIVFH